MRWGYFEPHRRGGGEEGVSLICCGGLGSERPAVMGAGGWKHVKLIYVCVFNTLNPRLQVNQLQLIALLYTHVCNQTVRLD